MGQTLTDLVTHAVFSTKDRRPLIDAEMRPRLFDYIGAIVRELNGYPIAINGTSDHVHLLLRLPPAVSLSYALRTIKTNSSRWIHETWSDKDGFSWQSGYGAFSVSKSVVSQVAAYIAAQEVHHQKQRFQDELLTFFKRHDLQYDERYIWK
ncbi:MAG: IS200/IS605 family transposase [Acidobacteriota bacterium]